MPLHTRNVETAERILICGHVLEVGVVEISMMKKGKVSRSGYLSQEKGAAAQ